MTGRSVLDVDGDQAGGGVVAAGVDDSEANGVGAVGDPGAVEVAEGTVFDGPSFGASVA